TAGARAGATARPTAGAAARAAAGATARPAARSGAGVSRTAVVRSRGSGVGNGLPLRNELEVLNDDLHVLTVRRRGFVAPEVHAQGHRLLRDAGRRIAGHVADRGKLPGA